MLENSNVRTTGVLTLEYSNVRTPALTLEAQIKNLIQILIQIQRKTLWGAFQLNFSIDYAQPRIKPDRMLDATPNDTPTDRDTYNRRLIRTNSQGKTQTIHHYCRLQLSEFH